MRLGRAQLQLLFLRLTHRGSAQARQLVRGFAVAQVQRLKDLLRQAP